MEPVKIKKHCRGCGQRLKVSDGAFWKSDNRCLSCRLRKYTSAPATVLQYPASAAPVPAILRSFYAR